VTQVDGTGGRFDEGPAEPDPGVVQQWSGEGDGADRDGRFETGDRGVTMTSGDADEFDAVVGGEFGGDPEGGDGGASRHVVPALLQGVRDAHGLTR
jgi:hypothetical protein